MTTSARRRPQFHPLTVAKVEKLTDDAVAVTFDIPDELVEDYRFKPGQALTLRRVDGDRDERRSYSICAPMGAQPRVGVREVPGGFFSSYLVHQVQPGDTIEVLPPSGTFTADLSVPGDHVFVVAGSGITPALSLAGSVLRDGTSHRHRLLRQPAHQHGDVRRRARRPEGPLRHPAAAGARALPRVARRRADQRPARRRPAAGAGRRTWSTPRTSTTGGCAGRTGWSTTPARCSPSSGVPAEKVHQELFYVDEIPPEPVRGDDQAVTGPSSQVTVILDGRSTTLALPRDESVLDSAQKVRGDLPFACKGGVCGTCRARVTDGEVVMRRNYALEAKEVDAGYVLTCQTLPITDAVTVDFDA